jgi:hypothetical protein
VLSFESVEEVCESKSITLVVHPAIRRALKGYEESFYIGLRCFLKGESDGIFFLPLHDSGYVRLAFSQRHSSGGHPILRVDPLSSAVEPATFRCGSRLPCLARPQHPRADTGHGQGEHPCPEWRARSLCEARAV